MIFFRHKSAKAQRRAKGFLRVPLRLRVFVAKKNIMKKVLITGANGFVGYYLVQQLLHKNYEIIATGKGPDKLPFSDPKLNYLSLDFTDRQKVEEVFRHYKPDIVIHSGAISKPDECEQNQEMAFRINVSGTENLLEAAALYQSLFILLSTDFVFDGKKGMYVEEDHREPVNFYGTTKMLAEDLVFRYPCSWAIARTISVYGKNHTERSNIVYSIAEAIRSGRQLKMFGDQVRTPTYVEDLASAIICIVEKRKTGIYHIGGEDVRTPYQMAVETAKYLGLDTDLISEVSEENFPQPARRPPKTGFNISKAKRELDFHPLSFREGLEKTFGV